MFDLTSSKLLILGVVALIVVGPKELPFLLRTIGKYMAMIRRQANEFRAQFDEAMREAELDSIRKDLETVARDTENTIRSAQTEVERDVASTTSEIDRSLQQPETTPSEPGPTHDMIDSTTASETHTTPATTSDEHTPATTAVDEHPVTPTSAPLQTSEPAPTATTTPSELAKTGT